MSGRADLPPGAGAPLVALVASAPVVAPELALGLADGPVVFWDAPVRGRRWAFAGWGEAARIEAQGEGALTEVAAGAARVLARVEGWAPEADAPGPRLFGGTAFSPGAQGAAGKGIEPPWGGFADASFVLPAWLYATDGERARLHAVVPREAAGTAAARREALCAALAALAAQRGAAVPREAPEGAPEHAELLSPDGWHALVRDALARFGEGSLEKVVLAAPSLLQAARPIAVAPALARLGEGYPECARFALQRGGAIFMGASPERLITASGRAVEVDALAGSTLRRRGEDDAAIRALLDSDKDRREHALVVEAITAVLRPVCEALEVPAAPVVRTLRNVHHLWTPIAGRLAEPAQALALAGRLHPTPAVCGTPRPGAIGWIREREPAPRGWYAGAVGWIGAGGDAALWVGIRAALVEARRAWLYAGVGLVAGSDPDAELAEARAKRRPMLAALGGAP